VAVQFARIHRWNEGGIKEGPVWRTGPNSQFQQRNEENMTTITRCPGWRNPSLQAKADICALTMSRAARRVRVLFDLPIATARTIARLAGYVVEVRHDR
jgi:hypothetical protein